MFRDLLDEIKTIFQGKTLDAVLPPLLFIVFIQLFTFNAGIIVAIVGGVVIFMYRVIRKKNPYYALGGLFGVLAAAFFAYIAGTASDYFIPQIISAGALVLLTAVTLAFNRPLAAWLSHLTRNFPLSWYWRQDVLPAYREVTVFWLVLLLVRFLILLGLYVVDDAVALAWANIVLGFPVILIVLVLTYIYGILRLINLGGPSVDEYKAGTRPPWTSQRKGF